MLYFLGGMLMMGCFVIAAFFWRFWLRTGDRLFIMFALAFALMGAERLGLAIINSPEEPKVGIFFLRLAAFLLIIIAILYKNRVPSR
jgi:Family of unknown function (DUF5985)